MTAQDERLREVAARHGRTADIDWPTALRRHRGLLALVVVLTLLIMVAVVVLAIGISDRLASLGGDHAGRDRTMLSQEQGQGKGP